MGRMKRETVIVEAKLIHETEKAWLLDINDEEMWIPKSQCEWTPHDDSEVEGTVEINKWFADKEGISS